MRYFCKKKGEEVNKGKVFFLLLAERLSKVSGMYPQKT